MSLLLRIRVWFASRKLAKSYLVPVVVRLVADVDASIERGR